VGEEPEIEKLSVESTSPFVGVSCKDRRKEASLGSG
jgi:hypothetical protein